MRSKTDGWKQTSTFTWQLNNAITSWNIHWNNFNIFYCSKDNFHQSISAFRKIHCLCIDYDECNWNTDISFAKILNHTHNLCLKYLPKIWQFTKYHWYFLRRQCNIPKCTGQTNVTTVLEMVEKQGLYNIRHILPFTASTSQICIC